MLDIKIEHIDVGGVHVIRRDGSYNLSYIIRTYDDTYHTDNSMIIHDIKYVLPGSCESYGMCDIIEAMADSVHGSSGVIWGNVLALIYVCSKIDKEYYKKFLANVCFNRDYDPYDSIYKVWEKIGPVMDVDDLKSKADIQRMSYSDFIDDFVGENITVFKDQARDFTHLSQRFLDNSSIFLIEFFDIINMMVFCGYMDSYEDLRGMMVHDL